MTDADIVDQLSNDKSNSTLASGFDVAGNKVKVHCAHFVGLTSSLSADDVVGKNRFEDNEELR